MINKLKNKICSEYLPIVLMYVASIINLIVCILISSNKENITDIFRLYLNMPFIITIGILLIVYFILILKRYREEENNHKLNIFLIITLVLSVVGILVTYGVSLYDKQGLATLITKIFFFNQMEDSQALFRLILLIIYTGLPVICIFTNLIIISNMLMESYVKPIIISLLINIFGTIVLLMILLFIVTLVHNPWVGIILLLVIIGGYIFSGAPIPIPEPTPTKKIKKEEPKEKKDNNIKKFTGNVKFEVSTSINHGGHNCIFAITFGGRNFVCTLNDYKQGKVKIELNGKEVKNIK